MSSTRRLCTRAARLLALACVRRAIPAAVAMLVSAAATTAGAQQLQATATRAAADSIAATRRAQGARPIPSAMDGITVTDAQRAAMLASWDLVRERWDAIMVRMRSGQPLSMADRATLRALSEEHNARVVALLTAEQRQKLEANLAVIRERTAAAMRGGGQ